jgi:hypothetical protein
MKMVAFSVSDEKKKEVESYAKAKGYGDSSHLARKALFVYMEKNKIGGHHARSEQGAVVRPEGEQPSDGGAA